MKCPSCAGTLYYDISKKQLKCHHCSQYFDVQSYEENNDAEESLVEGAKLYTCRNCGAELISADDEAVTYCSYCGSQALLESELEGIRRPKKIIPFQVDKSRCKQIYRKQLKNLLYVPSEFKDPEFIERFRPFYIPYWMYYVKFREEPFELDGYKDYTKGNYDYHEEYRIKAEIKDNGLYGVPYDASRNFDDSIAEEIAPFSRNQLKDYNPAYLAGMYADKPNVDASIYKEEVLDRACDVAIDDVQKSFGNITLKLPKGKKRKEFLQARYDGAETVFLPVWFLTWRKDNRVAYAVVNGQTGKIHIDLLADMKSFMQYTLAAAAILFLLLTLFVSVTSRFVLWFAALLAYLISRRYFKELKEIRDRENHVFDKGYLLNDDEQLSMPEKTRSRLRRKGLKRRGKIDVSTIILVVIFFYGAIFGFMGLMYDLLVSQSGALALTFLVLVAEIISFIKAVNVTRHLKNKRSFFISLLGLCAIAYSFIIASTMPVQDWWYYLGGLLCLSAAAIMSADLIFRYNESSTRPLPSFYNRKGGNDRA